MSRLYELRISRGLSQSRLAMEFNTSQQTISRIEHRGAQIPTDILIKASNYYRVSVDYILELTDEKHFTGGNNKELYFFNQYRDLLLDYEALSETNQRLIYGVIQKLKQLQFEKEQQASETEVKEPEKEQPEQ